MYALSIVFRILSLAKNGNIFISQAIDGKIPKFQTRLGYTVRPSRIKGESVLLNPVCIDTC